MADDLDQLIRTAMKTLDDEVPSGYFDALPNQTIARLEGSMQHGSSGTTETRDTVVSPPPVALDADHAQVATQPAPQAHAREGDEDSGLHDIRNLAQSTKQRLSRRSTQNPIIADDVLASSSGSFKNIALPQPANMVSLPSIDELPPKEEVIAADKAAKKAAKEAAKERKSEQKAAVVAPAAAVEAPAAAAPAVAPRKAFTLPSQQKKSKGPLIALVGTGLAAAAGAVIYMQVNKDQAAQQVAASEPAKADVVATGAGTAAPATAPIVEPIPTPAPEPVAAVPAEAPKEEAAAQLAADDAKAAEATDKKATKKGKKADKDDAKPAKIDAQPEKVETKKPADAKKGGGEEGEPSFDALLKEAGVTEKKEAKPVLEKKSLTGDDFKKGMSAPVTKAKGCYNGNQGTAMVKLTIAPSGQVSKVSVGGDFAGKPEASCVESAIRGATFPAWDGGPQSFTYSVLLSD